MSKITFDPEKFQLSTIQLKKQGEQFEIVVDPDAALAYRENPHDDVLSIVQTQDIFADAQKGQHASENKLQQIFQTLDTLQIITKILKNGELHFTTAYKKKLREKVKKQLVQLVHKYSIDPRTKLPHTISRIELVLSGAKVKIDEFKPAQSQLKNVIKSIQSELPLKFVQKEICVLLPTQYAHRAYGKVKQLGDMKREEWGSDGSLKLILIIPGGLEEEFYDVVNTITQGNAQVDVLSILE